MPRFFVAFVLAAAASAQSLSVGSAAFPDFAAAGVSSVAPGSLIVAIPPGRYPPLPAPSMIVLQMQPAGSTQIFPMSVTEVRSGMVFAVVPDAVPLGSTNVTMIVNGVSSSGNVSVSPASIALFASGRFGSGPAIAQNLTPGSPPSLNQLTNPALPGQYVTLWGTGLGNFAAPDVAVEVYGIKVQPSFAGHAPGQPGIDQIDFRVPDDVPGGCYIPVNITAGRKYGSNLVTIATTKSPGTPCTHPLGLSADQLKRLDAGGTMPMGSIATYSGAYPLESGDYQRDENVQVSFVQANAQDVFTGPLRPVPGSPICTDGQLFVTITATISSSPPIFAPPAFGDAGSALTFSGPDNQRLNLPRRNGLYSQALDPPAKAPTLAALPPSFLGGGSWTLGAAGGADIAAFQRSLTLPARLEWTNRNTLVSIDRSTDLVITWNSEGHAPTENVTVTLSSGSSRYTRCDASAQAGRLVVPRDILQELLPSSTANLSVSISSGPSVTDVPLGTGGSAPLTLSTYSSETIALAIR